MAFLTFTGARIAGISACVPRRRYSNLHPEHREDFSADYRPEDFVASTGVEETRATETLCTSDLCYAAAERLIGDLGWQRDEIDALVFVSQTPDYPMPCSACILQDRLGLSKECYAYDCTLGCSGWTYGMSQVLALMGAGSMRRALLLCGESHKVGPYYPRDPLFGAAGTATAIERTEGEGTFYGHYGTDGSEYDAIIVPHGGTRHPITPESFALTDLDGKQVNSLHAHMRGIDVFAFGISTAPRSIRALADHYGFDYRTADYYVLHQANMKMNSTITKMLRVDPARVPSSLRLFGNTSSASIPLTIVTELRQRLTDAPARLICCGFGVGLSWGTLAMQTSGLVIPALIEVDELAS